MSFASIISAMPQVKNNRLRPLAVTGGQRSPAAKELPTMIEAGVNGYESATWGTACSHWPVRRQTSTTS